MREIKFRAWSKGEQKWYYFGFDNLFSHDAIMPTVAIGKDRNTAKCLNHPEHGINPDIEIMQYTGLKDKNGKEIYEGDILEMSDKVITTMTPGMRVVVSYETSAFVATWGDFTEYNIAFIGWEIIGNIYENEELLTNK